MQDCTNCNKKFIVRQPDYSGEWEVILQEVATAVYCPFCGWGLVDICPIHRIPVIPGVECSVCKKQDRINQLYDNIISRMEEIGTIKLRVNRLRDCVDKEKEELLALLKSNVRNNKNEQQKN